MDELHVSNKRICNFCGKEITGRALKTHLIPKYLRGGSDPSNLVITCMECDNAKSKEDLKRYLADAVKSNTEYYETFVNSMNDIKELLNNSTYENSTKQVLFRLAYSNIVASMETYLSDAFINTVIKDNLLIRRLIETDSEFRKRKLTFSEIYTMLDDIKNTVREHLLDIIYHNIWVVKNMYKCVLNIDFPEGMDEINSSVMIRHDIVHRNGKNKKSGETLNLEKEAVFKCIEIMTNFINCVDSQLKKKGWQI